MNRIEAEVEHSAAIYTARHRGEWATLAALRARECGGAIHVHVLADGTTVVTCARCGHRGTWAPAEIWMLSGAVFGSCDRLAVVPA